MESQESVKRRKLNEGEANDEEGTKEQTNEEPKAVAEKPSEDGEDNLPEMPSLEVALNQEKEKDTVAALAQEDGAQQQDITTEEGKEDKQVNSSNELAATACRDPEVAKEPPIKPDLKVDTGGDAEPSNSTQPPKADPPTGNDIVNNNSVGAQQMQQTQQQADQQHLHNQQNHEHHVQQMQQLAPAPDMNSSNNNVDNSHQQNMDNNNNPAVQMNPYGPPQPAAPGYGYPPPYMGHPGYYGHPYPPPMQPPYWGGGSPPPHQHGGYMPSPYPPPPPPQYPVSPMAGGYPPPMHQPSGQVGGAPGYPQQEGSGSGGNGIDPPALHVSQQQQIQQQPPPPHHYYGMPPPPYPYHPHGGNLSPHQQQYHHPHYPPPHHPPPPPQQHQQQQQQPHQNHHARLEDANNKAATMGILTGRNPLQLYMACDDESLSPFQCMVRKNIELFEARNEDVESNAQGRNKPIVLGQVGIRCRHCSNLPARHRSRASVYYPAKLMGLYQAAQNMATIHLCQSCQKVPTPVRSELLALRERKSSAGGGKKYWGDGARVLGVYEAHDGLRFKMTEGP